MERLDSTLLMSDINQETYAITQLQTIWLLIIKHD